MGARRTPGAAGSAPSRRSLEEALGAEGLSSPRWWSNAPGDAYGWHAHPYHKVLYCQAGSITFHTDEGDLTLEAGDRLDIDPGVRHAATVGAEGVTCVESR